jgi:hypothetical protein
MDRHANLTQTLVTPEALLILYSMMKILLEELPEIDLLFRLSNEEDAKRIYRGAVADPIAKRRERDVPIQTARCQERQKVRLGLPPREGNRDVSGIRWGAGPTIKVLGCASSPHLSLGHRLGHRLGLVAW